MALPDLTGINIEDSYQRVVHTDGTDYYDGTGSLLDIGGTTFPYTGSAIISGALNVIGEFTASGIPYPTAIGGEGEAIVIDQDGNLVFAYPKAVTERVKNVSGGPLQKGTPVHATGSGASGNITGVVAADAGDPSLMPATFVLNEALADEAEGEALVIGYIQGVNTTGFQSGEVVYVGVGGGFTNVKPTGSALIQNLGLVLKGDSTNGSGVVYGSGRSNDVPNLPPGYAWVGNDNWVATAVPTSSFNEDPFPYTGSAVISGSLTVTGSISSTDTVTAVTGSFSHLKGNSPITVQDPTTFQQTLSVIGNATLSSINEVDIQTISKNFNYTSSLNVAEITASVNGAIIDYRLTNLNSGSRVGTFMYAHDGTTLSYNDLTIPGGGIGNQPILSASLVNDLVKIDIENAAGFNFTGYAKKFNKLANAIPVADPNVTYFMDITNNNPVAAFSVRQLDQFYTGSAMRVRRASDNNEIDIGFDINGNLDLITINTHCGSDIGYVTTWYDQSGNNNHATQSIASYQRRIYDGSNVYTINNKPALFGDTNDHWFHNMPAGTTWSSITVINPTGGNSFGMHSVLPYNPWFYLGDLNSGQTNVFGFNNGEIYQNTSQMSISTRGQFYTDINSIDQQVLTAFGDISFSSRPWRLGTSYGDGYGFAGYLQEAILYNTDESLNKNLYETNINDHYNIYDTGLLAEYPGAAAAYSVRQLTTAYTGSALRIREDGTNTETDIGFDSNGDLDTASIASHCGANNGLVVTWYDQSGNGNDAIQSTVGNQPKIYDGTTGVVTENGKPTVQFNGSKAINIGNYSSLTEGELFTTVRWMGDTTTRGGFKISTNGFDMHFPYYGGSVYDNFGSTSRYAFNPSITLNQLNLYNTLSKSGEWTARLNSNVEVTSATNTVAFSSGAIGSYTMNHNFSEFIIYTSDQSANRTGIEDNINSYFNIYS